MLAELFTLDVLQNLHAGGALESRVESIGCEAASTQTLYLILELFI